MDSSTHSDKLKTYLYTFAALIAFAANSVLCRLALKDGAIDPAGFTNLRLISGALTFIVLQALFSGRNQKLNNRKSAYFSALMLFIYAVAFSFAYITLDTGTGALILFGAVQLTMIITSWVRGKRLGSWEGLGITISFSGLIYLVYPTLSTPNVLGAVLMAISGAAWGFYTLAGKQASDPFLATAMNFKLTLPLVVILALVTLPNLTITLQGAIFAVLSGSLASALGYTIWYQALRGLQTSEAAVMQLSVPILAAVGGILFVSEPITSQFLIASILVLGGIAVVVKTSTHR